MNKAGYLVVITLLLCGCDNQAERLVQHEKTCLKALDLGLLEAADEQCTGALGTPGSDSLDPATRSARLFRLGSIKRQRTLYVEAERLMIQTLAIEQESAEPDAFALARRYHELTLALAGQGKWQQGLVYLEKLLPEILHFSADEQKALTNMMKLYVKNLKQAGQAPLVKPLEDFLQTADQQSP